MLVSKFLKSFDKHKVINLSSLTGFNNFLLFSGLFVFDTPPNSIRGILSGDYVAD
jgi:hypothetical protein